jgi:predicted RNase H-like HicB family nuclease
MSEYLITITIEPLEEGGYLATSNTVQGLIAEGRTVAETMEIAQDVARRLIESCIEHGDPLPPALRSIGAEGGEAQIAVTVSP